MLSPEQVGEGGVAARCVLWTRGADLSSESGFPTYRYPPIKPSHANHPPSASKAMPYTHTHMRTIHTHISFF